MKRSLFGFTLAEVLITLAIIGVVAALTIPTVVRNYQKQQTVVKLKKAYAEMHQAVELAQAEHGFMDTWEFAQENQLDKTKLFTNTYFFPYLKLTKTCIPTSDECWAQSRYLNGVADTNTNNTTKTISAIAVNGYSILTWVAASGENAPIYIDIDGPKKGKNLMGRDIFYLRINFYKSSISKIGIQLRGADDIPELSLEELKNTDSNGCSPSNRGVYCGALIQKSGWQIKDDYPW